MVKRFLTINLLLVIATTPITTTAAAAAAVHNSISHAAILRFLLY
jgi:hypothetical protein